MDEQSEGSAFSRELEAHPRFSERIETYLRRLHLALFAGDFGRAKRIIDDAESELEEVRSAKMEWNSSIYEMNPSVRVANALERANIHTIGQLVTRIEVLYEVDYIGPKTIKAIKRVLRRNGFRVK